MDKMIPHGLKITFLVHMVVAGIFGLAFVLIPKTFGDLMGAVIQEPDTFRLVGAALLAFAASSWFAYRETVWEKVKIVVQMEIVWTVLGVLVTLWGLIFGALPAADWMNVVILGIFAVVFTAFYYRA